jgi:hypothetical protein
VHRAAGGNGPTIHEADAGRGDGEEPAVAAKVVSAREAAGDKQMRFGEAKPT